MLVGLLCGLVTVAVVAESLCVRKPLVPMIDHLWTQYQGPDPMGFLSTQ